MTDATLDGKACAGLEKALEEQGMLICPIRGVSMLPLLDEGKDLIKLVPAREGLKVYDVPLYRRRRDNALVLHRIVDVLEGEGKYVICGDNCLGRELVPFEDVIAVMEGYFKDGRYIPCTDPEYLEYVKARCADIPGRKIYRRKRTVSDYARAVKRRIALIWRQTNTEKN